MPQEVLSEQLKRFEQAGCSDKAITNMMVDHQVSSGGLNPSSMNWNRLDKSLQTNKPEGFRVPEVEVKHYVENLYNEYRTKFAPYIKGTDWTSPSVTLYSAANVTTTMLYQHVVTSHYVCADGEHTIHRVTYSTKTTTLRLYQQEDIYKSGELTQPFKDQWKQDKKQAAKDAFKQIGQTLLPTVGLGFKTGPGWNYDWYFSIGDYKVEVPVSHTGFGTGSSPTTDVPMPNWQQSMDNIPMWGLESMGGDLVSPITLVISTGTLDSLANYQEVPIEVLDRVVKHGVPKQEFDNLLRTTTGSIVPLSGVLLNSEQAKRLGVMIPDGSYYHIKGYNVITPQVGHSSYTVYSSDFKSTLINHSTVSAIQVYGTVVKITTTSGFTMEIPGFKSKSVAIDWSQNHFTGVPLSIK